ncbi:hypothetical protein MLD38_023182 [Melastoma candidum]|uniref:Uncharacterized protein n=1 Tax=Melastoma candidum TaxID=119954 RepID=A0ACB9QMV5_9MYRT|nr:hypothetical protein MLD38_023182 [Melastoma candidum]
MMMLPSLMLVCIVGWLSSAEVSQAVWLSVPERKTKCVYESMQTGVVVSGEYFVMEDDHPEAPAVSIKVTSPSGQVLHRNSDVVHGHFDFTTSEAGEYMACFWVDDREEDVSVNIDWKTGIAARDWDSVARVEKIEGVELELRKLEGAVTAIHENILHLKSREATMRLASERTNARVAWLSCLSLGVCITVSTLQLLHLKQFFRKKKLI